MKTLLVASNIGLVLLVAGCNRQSLETPAPDFTLSSLNGEVFTRSLMKDKAVLVCFWAVG